MVMRRSGDPTKDSVRPTRLRRPSLRHPHRGSPSHHPTARHPHRWSQSHRPRSRHPHRGSQSRRPTARHPHHWSQSRRPTARRSPPCPIARPRAPSHRWPQSAPRARRCSPPQHLDRRLQNASRAHRRHPHRHQAPSHHGQRSPPPPTRTGRVGRPSQGPRPNPVRASATLRMLRWPRSGGKRAPRTAPATVGGLASRTRDCTSPAGRRRTPSRRHHISRSASSGAPQASHSPSSARSSMSAAPTGGMVSFWSAARAQIPAAWLRMSSISSKLTISGAPWR